MIDRVYKRLYPDEPAGGHDNSFRKLLQDRMEILQQYINEGMMVPDLGCGSCFLILTYAQ
jgi:hypothetical protein